MMRTMQYTYDNAKTCILKNRKLRSLYNNVLFIFECYKTPSGMKKHHKSTKPQSWQMAKIFLSLVQPGILV